MVERKNAGQFLKHSSSIPLRGEEGRLVQAPPINFFLDQSCVYYHSLCRCRKTSIIFESHSDRLFCSS